MKWLFVILSATAVLFPSHGLFAQDVEFIGSYDSTDNAWDIFVSGDYAYVPDRDSGLQIVDVSDPYEPVLAGGYETPGEAYAVFVSGDHAYVTWTGVYGYPGGLLIIDISDPYNPALEGSYDGFNSAHDVFVSGSYAYVAGRFGRFAGGLGILDVSEPTNPVLAGTYSLCGGGSRIFVYGNYAYLSGLDCEGGDPFFQIINVSDPTNPTFTSWVSAFARGVFVAGDYLYTAGWGGLSIFDVSDPANAFLAGSYETPVEAWDVYVSDDYAYVADGNSGLQVVNVSDPYNPALAGSYDTRGDARSVCVQGVYAYVADSSSLIILRYEPQTGIGERGGPPNRSSLEQNYPNPFNASTSLSYTLTETGDVTIDIYDLLGRRVRELFNANQFAGEHQILWDAGDLPSGVYFARLRTGLQLDVIRMTLLK